MIISLATLLEVIAVAFSSGAVIATASEVLYFENGDSTLCWSSRESFNNRYEIIPHTGKINISFSLEE